MPELTLYHLKPGSAFHLGQRGVGQEGTAVFLPADSLFAALLAAWVDFGRSPETLVKPFTEDDGRNAPFLLTSALPYAGEVRFYPALPLSLLNLSEDSVENRLKELKAVQFFSEAIFKKAVAGEALDEWLPDPGTAQPGDKGLYMQRKELWLAADEIAGLPAAMQKDGKKERPRQTLRRLRVWKTSKVPRVAVDRIRNASNIYHTGRLTFSPGCGLWFGIAWRQPELAVGPSGQTLRQAIDQALKLLADTGLGGERAVGYGHFSAREVETKKVETIRWDDPAEGGLFVTLSRYHPRPAELAAALRQEPVAYKLVPVGGWLGSPSASAQRRQRLWLIGEGSVVRAVGPGPWGDITDVRPRYERPDFPPPVEGYTFPHPVWRYGLACPVALKEVPHGV